MLVNIIYKLPQAGRQAGMQKAREWTMTIHSVARKRERITPAATTTEYEQEQDQNIVVVAQPPSYCIRQAVIATSATEINKCFIVKFRWCTVGRFIAVSITALLCTVVSPIIKSLATVVMKKENAALIIAMVQYLRSLYVMELKTN